MDRPDDHDQYPSWSPENARWFYPSSSRSANVPGQSSSQQSRDNTIGSLSSPSVSDAQPGPSHPPRPRPAYRGTTAYHPTAALAPASFDPLPSFSTGFPPIPPGSHPFVLSHTGPFIPPSQHSPSAGPPLPSTSNTASGSHVSAPVYPPFLRSEPSSREGSPELHGPHHPAPLPNPATAASTPKPDKGKKRASEPATGSAPKRAKLTAPRSKAADPVPKLSAKAKGKQPARATAAQLASHTGRQAGASNYTDEDMDALLDLVSEDLPIGQNAWLRITESFNNWARENGRPPRTQKPLKTKYDALVRTPKPTGSASVPPNVERAWEIEEQINERIHLGVFDDGEIADTNEEVDEGVIEVMDNGDDSDIEIVERRTTANSTTRKAATSSVTQSARKASTSAPVMKAYRDQAGSSSARAASSNRRAQAQDFMTAVTTSLDPAAREARDEARFARKFTQDELLRLSNDNRELRARNDTLSDRLQQQMSEVTRLQSRLEMLEMMQTVRRHSRPRADDWDDEDSPHPRRHRSYVPRPSPHLPSPSPHRRHPARSFARSPPPPPIHAPATGLEALAAAASAGAHSNAAVPEVMDSASITLTFSPSRHRRAHEDQENELEDYDHSQYASR